MKPHDIINKLESTVVDYLDLKRDELVEGQYLDSELLQCQSPIEQMMYLSLYDFFKNFEHFSERYIMSLEVQKTIKFRSKEYKTDIYIVFTDFKMEKSHEFAIECDGHEFHEKTKEQVRSDRERERNIMKSGCKVIRFSGSEIFGDPDECALEVWEIIKKQAGIML